VFGGHLWELVLVLLLALLVFGPKRLPEIGGSLGKGIKEFRKGTSDLGDSVMNRDREIPDAPRTAPTPDEATVQSHHEPAPPPPRERDAS